MRSPARRTSRTTLRWVQGFGAFALALCGHVRTAYAEPQFGAAATGGVALADWRTRRSPEVLAHLGGRFDVLFLRKQAERMALGPYVDVVTLGFETIEGGAGLEWLVPVSDTALILSGGGFARSSRWGVEPGAAATIFWGSRSFNYHGAYSLGVGLFAQGRYGISGPGRQADVLAGVQVDLAYFALPVIFVVEALRR